MNVDFDTFIEAFLNKVTEYDLIEVNAEDRQTIVDSYLRGAVSMFKKSCKYDLASAMDKAERAFVVDINDEDVDELVDIISEGMVVQWLKPYTYRQELLENVLNSRDWTSYSPAELLKRVSDLYKSAQKDYTQMVREYSYNHNDLRGLHL